jgi:hypothetical protein
MRASSTIGAVAKDGVQAHQSDVLRREIGGGIRNG